MLTDMTQSCVVVFSSHDNAFFWTREIRMHDHESALQLYTIRMQLRSCNYIYSQKIFHLDGHSDPPVH